MKSAKSIGVLVTLLLLIATPPAIAVDIDPQQRAFWGNFGGEAIFPTNDNCLSVTGAPFQTLSATEGKMTHLGRTEFITAHCATQDGQAAVGGMATLIAANGDEVWLTYSATTVGPPAGGPPPVIPQLAEFRIGGGTGRFEGASGVLTGMVYITFLGFDVPAWPIEFVLAGTIVY